MEQTEYSFEKDMLIVNVGKELDHHNASVIKAEIENIMKEKNISDIVFDFNRTDFMDSSGIGIIIGRYKYLNHKGGKIYVRNTKSNIERILTISGMYKIVEKM